MKGQTREPYTHTRESDVVSIRERHSLSLIDFSIFYVILKRTC
jgi:hypothetical protein